MQIRESLTKNESSGHINEQYALPKALKIYKTSDFATQQKAGFIFYLTIFILSSLVIFISTSIYLQMIRTEYAGIYLPVLLPIFALVIVFSGSLLLLIKGYYGIAAHSIMISGIITIWLVMWLDKGNYLARLDTIVMIVAFINLAPLFISKYKSTILAYIFANIAILIFYMWVWGPKMGLSLSSSFDYVIDTSMAMLFTGIIGYNIFTINKKTLDRALLEIKERKQAEEVLKENELFRKRVFDSSNISIVVMDADTFKYIDCNPAAAKIYHFPSRESALGKTPTDVSAPFQYDGTPSAEKAKYYIQKALEDGSVSFEWLHCRPNGDLWDAEVHLMSFTSGEHNLLQFSMIDITERKKIENALKESEEKYRYLLENMNEVVMMVDNDDKILFVNRKFTEILEYKEDEIIGEIGYLKLLDSSDHQIIINENKDRIQKKINQYELTFRAKSGRKIDFLVSGVPIIDSDGKTQGSIGTMTDITERKQAEKALKESEELFKSLIDLAPYGILVNDYDGRYLIVNKAFCNDCGYDANEIIGKTEQELGMNIDQKEIDFISGEILQKGFINNFEVSYTSKQGEIVYSLYSCRIIQMNNQNVVMTSSVNITEKKKVEQDLEKYRNHLELLVKERTEELAASNEELNATNEELYDQKEELQASLNKLFETQKKLVQSEKMASLGILSAGIAHEINNPLNFIHGGALGIESYFKENDQEHFKEIEPLINAINIGVSRAASIVTSLSHYSRQDDLPGINCNMHEIINNSLVMLQSEIRNKVEVKKHFTDKPVMVFGNEGKLHQAMLNIFSNAVQSIENQGNIEIETKIDNNLLIIVINDTGCGISNQNIRKVFDPFFTTKDPGKGTGLGLAITYNIVHEHNGSIDIESEPGKGTKVTIKFPFV